MHLLLTGASRGLGDALSRLLPQPGDDFTLLSRTRPPSLDANDGIARAWLPLDLADAAQVEQAALPLGPLDALIHNAGVWERTAFSQRYRFEDVTAEEEKRILQVNLHAPLVLTRRLLPHLRASANPKIIFIGSTNGLENAGASEAAYGASKWGLRGLSHALREAVRADHIGVTVINCGTLGDRLHNATGDVIGEGIPYEDMARIVRMVLDTSRRTVVKEIDVPAQLDPSV